LAVLVLACFELPHPVASTTTGAKTKNIMRGLNDRCISADI
jgi:hypothetical protein